jgi:hypothetical protein
MEDTLTNGSHRRRSDEEKKEKKRGEIKTQDRTLNKNNNPGLVFLLKKSMIFFLKLII